MHLINLRQTTRWFLPLVLVLALIAACGSDDDADETLIPDVDTTATDGAGVEGTAEADSTGTSDADTTGTADMDVTGTADTDVTGTADADTTGTADADVTGTADEDGTGTADADVTGTADDDVTETADADVTGTADTDVTGTAEADETGTPDADDPLANLGDVSELENYTLTAEGTFDFTGAGAQEFVMNVQQASPENYHFTVEIQSADPIEVWVVDDTLYVQAGDTGIQELPFVPDDVTSQFSPSFYLNALQDTEVLQNAQLEDEEEIDGRETTRYTMTAEDWAAAAAEGGVEPEDVSGTGAEFWVDNEENVIIRAEIDTSWTVDDEDFEQTVTWDVTDIGETDEVEAPS
jgi:hypothetical protein